ncbi:MAG: tyrosine-type recombinase/integrase [Candidatus Thiodiazotropha sp. (ex Lucinoma kastoroae)]|nr:tyrosine-type recombinase/integrase [Candidatus Thiodiazotropha sp. (ex Lucinoma kastoroae)]
MRHRKKDRHLPQCVYPKHGAYYYVKGGKWTPLGRDLAAALQEYAKITTPGGGMNKIIDRIINDARDRVKPNTLSQYELAAKNLKTAFKEFSAAQVKPEHIFQFMDHHRDTPNMANRMRSVLKMAFDYAVQSGQCPSNPVLAISRHAEKKRNRYLTDAEYWAIWRAGSPTMRAIMDVAYATGQRIGDVLAIKMADVSKHGIAFEQEKTGKKLRVNSQTMPDAVKAARKLHPKNVIPTYLLGQHNGKIRKYSGVKDLFYRATAKARVKDAHLHDIRAKAITDAKKQGLNPQALAGHTTEAQTVRYIRDREIEQVTGPVLDTSKMILDNRA